MDNLSHTLVGLAFGELVQRSFAAEPDPERQGRRHRLLLTAGALASNFPDLDLVLSPLLPAPLGYLLHHRGHTHTLLYALPQALLLIALLWALWPGARTLLRASATARTGLALTTGAGLLLHLSMDYLNSYGIHPFAPFDARWRYGDMVFILEPLFWVACGIPLALMPRRLPLRIALSATMAVALAFFTYKGYLHGASLAALAIIGAVLALLQWRAGPSGKIALGAGLLTMCVFIGIQGAASADGKNRIRAQLQRLDPHSEVLDIAMTAYPANPLCWNILTIERNTGAGRYRLRRGRFALAPSVLALDDCPAALSESLPAHRSDATLAFNWQREAGLAELQALDRSNCQVSAWLRFARAPLLHEGAAIEARFGTESVASFANLPYARFAGQPCGPVPQWGKPRQDLLIPMRPPLSSD